MSDDPIAALAVGVAADHQEAKRRGKAAAKKAGDDAGQAAADAGSPPDDAAALAKVVEQGAADAINDPALREAVQSMGDKIDDQDEEQDRATDLMIERLVRIAETAELDSGTLVGDVRDTLVDLFKANPKPWSAIPEDQQRRIVDGLATTARTLIRAIVVIVAEDSEEGGSIHAKLESYAEKGGLKIALTANGDRDTVLALHDAVGQQVVVKRADSNRYGGQRRDPDIMADQPGLGFEADSDRRPDPFAAPDNGDADLVDAADGLGSDSDDRGGATGVDGENTRTHGDSSAVDD